MMLLFSNPSNFLCAYCGATRSKSSSIKGCASWRTQSGLAFSIVEAMTQQARALSCSLTAKTDRYAVATLRTGVPGLSVFEEGQGIRYGEALFSEAAESV